MFTYCNTGITSYHLILGLLYILQRTSETNIQSKSDENGFYNVDLNDQYRLWWGCHVKSKSCAKDLVKDRCNCDCFVVCVMFTFYILFIKEILYINNTHVLFRICWNYLGKVIKTRCYKYQKIISRSWKSQRVHADNELFVFQRCLNNIDWSLYIFQCLFQW